MNAILWGVLAIGLFSVVGFALLTAGSFLPQSWRDRLPTSRSGRRVGWLSVVASLALFAVALFHEDGLSALYAAALALFCVCQLLVAPKNKNNTGSGASA